MIDFRYHLVSLVAVFLALAVGIVLGTTALNGPLTRGLQSTEAKLTPAWSPRQPRGCSPGCCRGSRWCWSPRPARTAPWWPG
jgi:hypothetical protein